MSSAEIRSRLLRWYRSERRDLPWRRRRDPYAIWISEVMLQQTRVDTVIPYFERFLTRWPTAAALAAADPDEVRAAWSGLGYYRRARLMMDAAQTLVAEHGGQLPANADALGELPGFGRYTAGAVASIAFDLPVPAVDGNVQRVLARLYGIEGDVSAGAPNQAVWEAATRLAPGESPGELSQALIELGALVCALRNPACAACPVAGACVARKRGKLDLIPPPKKRAARKTLELTAVLALDAAPSVLLERQPESGLFASLWCLPMLEGRLEPDAVLDEAERKYGWTLGPISIVAELKHVLTHRDIEMRVVLTDARDDPEGAALRRVRLSELGSFGVPSLTVRALEAGLPAWALAGARLPKRRDLAAKPKAR